MAIIDNCSQSINNMNKRKLIIWGGVGTVAIIIIIIIISVSSSSESMPSKGRDALNNVPLIDGHNDLPNNLRIILQNNLTAFQFEKNLSGDPLWQYKNSTFTDLPRLKKGKVGAQFWVAYVDCDKTQYTDAVAETLEQIDVIKRLIKKYPNDLEYVITAEGITKAFQKGKIGSLIAVEGGHSIDSRLGILRTFYELGVRYMTLTHTCNTPWAVASPSNETYNLTDFGKIVVKEMNRLGMMVDLSHVSKGVMLDALKVSRAPIIFSHSSAYNVTPHHRNVPDDVLDKVKENDGIVMVNFYPGFIAVNGTHNNTNITTVIKHINYIANKIGVEHVGIGADYDGIRDIPTGLEDVSKYPDLFDALYISDSTKWSISNLEKLAGKNLLRVFEKVEKVRDDLSKEKPYEDWISNEELKKIPEHLTQCRSPYESSNKTITTAIDTNIKSTKSNNSTNSKSTTANQKNN